MSDAAPHPTGPRTGTRATVLRALLWLFVLLAGFAVVLVLPMILVLNATGGGRPGIWPLYIWLPIVFLACVYAVVRGVRAMADPKLGIVAALAVLAIVAFFSFPPLLVAGVVMKKRSILSSHDGFRLESFTAAAPGAGPRPGVLLFPNFLGLDHVDDENAERLVALGYTAFGCDLYGKGNRATTREEGFALMSPLSNDRPLLQARMAHLLEVARQQPEVDADRVAAIGFCFGGLCVLDLARTGADVKGVASFHGLFVPPPNIPKPRISARVAVYHGWEDAIVPPDHVTMLGAELTGAGCDWQIHCYGGAVHGFTHARAPEEGIPSNELADKRSRKSAADFLTECFA